ncbi:hypothetical protein RSOL_378360 [Rhizoctonia solani AG-3 Rhs1AP]|uniref:Uncharacterized protein n=2 Tax=Rhizoctonia solani AG-3 TaxID=1086053 RepID=A0A074SIQ0_9AGAM|nr:hypothetical protein RSOL_378360 [Rhizoctonia solani AG-3 Rhs1AP]KEP49862.1 hypothetical protein V565_091410 [Rhizoctonia solani 123E]
MVSPWMGQGNLHRYLERTPGVNRGSLVRQFTQFFFQVTDSISSASKYVRGKRTYLRGWYPGSCRFWEFYPYDPEYEIYANNH